jgi:hypothetical protein
MINLNILKRPIRNSTEEDIRKACAEEHKIIFNYNTHKCELVLAEPRASGMRQVAENCVCRFNVENPLIIGIYENELSLQNFLTKRRENYEWVQNMICDFRKRNPLCETQWPARFNEEVSRIEARVPHAPEFLATIALAGVQFDMACWRAIVENEEQRLMLELGVLPKRASILPIWQGSRDKFQPALKVTWNQKQ